MTDDGSTELVDVRGPTSNAQKKFEIRTSKSEIASA